MPQADRICSREPRDDRSQCPILSSYAPLATGQHHTTTRSGTFFFCGRDKQSSLIAPSRLALRVASKFTDTTLELAWLLEIVIHPQYLAFLVALCESSISSDHPLHRYLTQLVRT